MKKNQASIRVLAAGLGFTLLFGTLTACGNQGKDTKKTTAGNNASAKADSPIAKGSELPISKEKINYTAMMIQTSSLKAAKDKKPVIDAEKATNIHFEWSEVPASGWKEKINILLSTNSMPDLVIGDVNPSTNYTQLLPLDDYFKDYAPNFTKFLSERKDYNAALRAPDGKIYSLPIGDESYPNKVDSKMWINTEWLAKLGLKMPQTTEEFEKVLYAFKNNDPNGNNQKDEIPLSFRNIWGWAQGGETFFGQFGVIENGSHVFVKDKKVVFSPQEEGYKKALQWFAKLYKDGVLDQDAFIMSSDNYAVRDGGKNIVGAFAGYNPTEIGVKNNEKGDRYQCIPALKGPDGEQMIGFNSILRSDGFSINKNAKTPEALVRFYDYINSSVQLKLEWGRGKEGEFWKWAQNDKGEKVPMFIENTPEQWKALGYTNRAEYRNAESFAGQTPALYTEQLDKMKVPDPNAKINYGELGVKMWEPYAVYGLPDGSAKPENIERRTILLTDIDNYLTKFVADSIMNGLTEDQWKQHIDTLKTLNVEEYVKLCQEYTDSVTK